MARKIAASDRRKVQLASAVHLLAFSGLAASGHCATTSDPTEAHAGVGVGGGQRATGQDHGRYRHPVHTLFGQQMGGRKGYDPKNKGIALG
jgi:hypothetical protein